MGKKVDLRKAARGRPCTLRLQPICDGGGDTSVLAHLRVDHFAAGKKPSDWTAIIACGPCHESLDGRDNYRPTDYDILVALCRTLRVWEQEGYL